MCTGERGICELRLDGVVPLSTSGAALNETTVKVQPSSQLRYTWATVDASILRKQVSVFFVPGNTMQSINRELFAPGYKSMTWVKQRTQLNVGVGIGSPTGVINRNKMGLTGNNVIGRTRNV